MRIDRPIGTWLVLLPGWWGLALGAAPGDFPDARLAALFAVGAFAMRGAGCTVNDMWDKDFDGKVARTAQRPLASGRVSQLQALGFLGAQLAVAATALLSLDAATIKVGLVALPLAVLYPLMKRVTHLPQLVLGLAMNYGILVGVSAAAAATAGGQPLLSTGFDLVLAWLASEQTASQALATVAAAPLAASASWAPAALLYSGAVAWTLVYDTLYAHQDKDDDARLGLKSTALLFGDHSRGILSAAAVASAGLWLACSASAHLAWPAFAMASAAGGHQLAQVRTANFSDRANLTARFVSNTHVGWAMLAGLVAGQAWAIP